MLPKKNLGLPMRGKKRGKRTDDDSQKRGSLLAGENSPTFDMKKKTRRRPEGRHKGGIKNKPTDVRRRKKEKAYSQGRSPSINTVKGDEKRLKKPG